MWRVSRGVAAGIVAGAVLFGETARADTTTTTSTSRTTTSSTSTTSTTLLPHPFSQATEACIRQAKHAFGCELIRASCSTAFQTAYANCFAPKTGVSCATKCVTKATSCLGAAPATRKTCDATCVTSRRKDLFACRRIPSGDKLWSGGDGACLTTAQANFFLCKFVCAEARLDCRTNFTFCIADCPNL